VLKELLVDNAGLPQVPEDLSISSEKLSEFSSAPVRDIPEAVRELPDRKRQHRSNQHRSNHRSNRSRIFLGLAGLGFVMAIALSLSLVWMQTRSISSAVNSAEVAPSEPARESISVSSPTVSNAPDAPVSSAELEASPLLNHFPYEEAPASELEPVSSDGSIMLRRAAATKFLEMVDAARADGIRIAPLSGFRSLDQQESLFFDVKAERGQQATLRAEVSAPPGYSEHHTGYAIDVGDEYFPDTDLRVSFERTPAFEWLNENAAYYSFELSFPEDSPHGVSYEPWHWRYVGDRHSLETFYRARTTTQTETLPNSPSSSPRSDFESNEPNNP
jgi:D-alanyl-D-alanine carboxypeptidase